MIGGAERHHLDRVVIGDRDQARRREREGDADIGVARRHHLGDLGGRQHLHLEADARMGGVELRDGVRQQVEGEALRGRDPDEAAGQALQFLDLGCDLLGPDQGLVRVLPPGAPRPGSAPCRAGAARTGRSRVRASRLAICRLIAEAATFSCVEAAAIEPGAGDGQEVAQARTSACAITYPLPKRHGSNREILLVAMPNAQHHGRAKKAAVDARRSRCLPRGRRETDRSWRAGS